MNAPRQQQQPPVQRHDRVRELAAKGLDTEQIAQRVGYTVKRVRQILRDTR